MTYEDFNAAWVLQFGYDWVKHDDAIAFKELFVEMIPKDKHPHWLTSNPLIEESQFYHTGYQWRVVKESKD